MVPVGHEAVAAAIQNRLEVVQGRIWPATADAPAGRRVAHILPAQASSNAATGAAARRVNPTVYNATFVFLRCVLCVR